MKTIDISFIKGVKGNFQTLDTTLETLKQDIMVLISTEPKTKVMENDYGAGLKKFLFTPNDSTTRSLITTYLTDKIKKYVPQVKVEKIEVQIMDTSDNGIFVNLVCSYNKQEINLKFQVTP